MTDLIVHENKKGGLKKRDPFSGLANVATGIETASEQSQHVAKGIGAAMKARDLSQVAKIDFKPPMTREEKRALPKVPESLKYLTLSDILKECAEANFESTTHSGIGETGKGGHLVEEHKDAQGNVHRTYSDEGEYRCSVATMTEWLGSRGYQCPDPMGQHQQSYMVAKKYHLKFADHPLPCPLCNRTLPQQVELAFHMSSEHNMRVPAVAYKIAEVEVGQGIY